MTKSMSKVMEYIWRDLRRTSVCLITSTKPEISAGMGDVDGVSRYAADTVAVLSQGQIIEQGEADALIEKETAFRALVEKQLSQ